MTPKEKQIFDLVRAELKPEMVPEEYRRLVDSAYCGHCHHATIAMYSLLGGKEARYRVRKAVDDLRITHYWLESPTGEVIDPTAEQYTDLGRRLPYQNPVARGVSYRRMKHANSIIAAVEVSLSQDSAINN